LILKDFNLRTDSYGTDAFIVYDQTLAPGAHYQGKDHTVALERTNAQQRHWTAALRRRSIVVSRSMAMPRAHPKDALPARQRRQAAAKGIERRVALLAHLHVNREAPPDQGNRIWSLRLLKAGAAPWRSGAINSD
jgi:insertion element IS1 protein InsB